VVSFTGVGNRRTRRKPLAYSKWRSNIVT